MRLFSLISLLITVAAYHFKNDAVTSTLKQFSGSLTENIMLATNNLNMKCLENREAGLSFVGYLFCDENNRLSFNILESRAMRTVSISNAARLTCKVPDCLVQSTSQWKPTGKSLDKSDTWTSSKQSETFQGRILYITASSNNKIIYGVGVVRRTCQFIKFNLNNNTTRNGIVHDFKMWRQLCGLTAGPCSLGVATCIYLCSSATQHFYGVSSGSRSGTIEFKEPDLAVKGREVTFNGVRDRVMSVSIDTHKQIYILVEASSFFDEDIQLFRRNKYFWSGRTLMKKKYVLTLEIMKITSKIISTTSGKIEICQYLQKSSSRSFCRKPIVHRKRKSDVVCWLDPTNVITINRKFPYSKKIISL